jgi:hypothetical protein
MEEVMDASNDVTDLAEARLQLAVAQRLAEVRKYTWQKFPTATQYKTQAKLLEQAKLIIDLVRTGS